MIMCVELVIGPHVDAGVDTITDLWLGAVGCDYGGGRGYWGQGGG